MAALSPCPTLDNLKITIHHSSLVFPSQETQKKSIFLSNIDYMANYNVSLANFFKPNPDFPSEILAKRLKMALEKVLMHYDFMAGRLKLIYETGRLEIDCNRAGVGFVVASSEFSINEIGSFLVHPNLGYRQLVVEKLENLAPEVDQPLCFFQLTTFKCGGFAIGMCTNHILLDGIGAATFFENLASQAFNDKPLAAVICNNRRLLAARSPPQVSFTHSEFLDLNLPTGEGSSPPPFDCGMDEEVKLKIFKLSPTDISKLKLSAAANGAMKISTFAVTAALIWRCKALSGDMKHKKERVSTLLNVINIRTRRNPQLLPTYCGNAVLPIVVSTTIEEIENGPFSKMVEIISKGPDIMTDEYVRSAFDWMEVHRGVPNADYMVTSWLSLGFERVRYPWGEPIYCCPVVNHMKDICWIFRDATDGGVGALVSLPAQEMEIFEDIFLKFFA